MRRKIVFAAVTILAITVIGSGAYVGYSRWWTSRIAALREQCREAQKASDWKTLGEVARSWTKIQPEEADGWIFLAVALQEQGDLPGSAEVLTHLPDSSSKTVPALLELSALQFGPLNKPLDGISTCERILRIQPRILEAHRRIIFFRAINLQRAAMTSQIYRAIELGCEPREAYVYLMLGEVPIFSNGFETANHWLQNDPESELFLVARTVQLAENLTILRTPTSESTAQLERAEEILTEYRQRFPHNRVVLWYFLKKAAHQSDVEEVAKLLAAVPSDAGDESVFWRYRGWYHTQQNEVAEAEAAYRRAAELTPLDALIWHELADVLRKKGDLAQADSMQSVAAAGRQLRLELQKLKDAGTVGEQQLDNIRIYAEACGDDVVGAALRRRLGIPLDL